MRISVVGCPGAGKSSLARVLAERLGSSHIELDALFHQHGWTELGAEEFRRRVEHAASGDQWVIDGNYSTVLDLVWARADTVVWLDLPRPLVMRRIVRRTLVRAATRRELWNGNRERPSNLIRTDDRNIVLWTWRHYQRYHDRYLHAVSAPENSHLQFIRLTSPADVRELLGQWPGSAS